MKKQTEISLVRKITFSMILLLSVFALHGEEPCLYAEIEKDDPVNIGSRLELFIDHFLIEKQTNIRHILHEPKDEGSVLLFDNPWEGPFCGYATVIKDKNKYRLYYRGLPEAGMDGSTVETTCYAESEDGFEWSKPNLGIYECAGTMNNNVILADDAPFSHNFSPFLDKKPDTPPAEKYKAMAGTRSTGLTGFQSPDGIHWQKIRDTPLFTEGVFDSQNVVFWSQAEKCYACYFRTWTGEGYEGIRTISRTTSKDFIHWSEPVEMDFGNHPKY